MTCTRCKQPIDGVHQPYHRTRRGYHHRVCPPQPSEEQIQETCTRLLELDGWRALRTDPCSDRARGKGFGEVGMADYLYIRYNVFGEDETLWVEWKCKRGK